MWRVVELFDFISREFCKSRSMQKNIIIIYYDFSMDLAYLCNVTLWYVIHIYDVYGIMHKVYSISARVERFTTQCSFPLSIDEVMIKLKMKHI